MRLFTIGLFAGFVLAVAEPALSPEQNEVSTEEAGETVEIDPVTTGITISSDHFAKWEAQRKLYLECPECVASQPFPED